MVKALRPEIKERLDEFISQEFSPRGRRRTRIIGVHFRFGNGEKFGRRPANSTAQVLRTAAAVERVSAALGYENVRVLVATDDASALDTLRKHTKLDVFARPQWRPPPAPVIVFSSWRTKDHLDDKIKEATEAAHRSVVKDANTPRGSGRRHAHRLAPLRYADARWSCALDVYRPPEGHEHSRGAPSCMFIGETWRDLNIKKRDLELTRRPPRPRGPRVNLSTESAGAGPRELVGGALVSARVL